MNPFRSILVAALLAVSGVTMGDQEGPGGLTAGDVEAWLAAYEAAWEELDADKAVQIFTEDASYQDDPYSDPYLGRDGIHQYWATVTSDQKDVDFTSEVLAVTDNTGIAHWHSEFTQASTGGLIVLDGIFVLEFAGDGKCRSLREWWHIKLPQ